MNGTMTKNNGYVLHVRKIDMQQKINNILILIVFLISSSCSKTSTPKEFLYKTNIPTITYQRDVKKLTALTQSWLDSIRIVKEKKGVYSSKTLEVVIDTIFYGTNNKIAYLVVNKSKNKYAKTQDLKNKEGIQYNGECFIGERDSVHKTFIISKNLKYSVSSSDMDGYEYVLKTLREMYFREIGYIDKRYNINDIRFWDSDVWKQDYN